ncbi:hypothetical protein BDC45DRAFT_499241 [Circinella umbellata]|nr:hypothetical protein BDC45DRAFT_499236 [Circinella umbellata]KAI7858275.1 hypothetical protein BDC45DRAFT_499241 [Circinella umbellata]
MNAKSCMITIWIPMSNKERSRCIRWRIGWLPGGKHKTCLTCQSHTFTKHHAIQCLQMHRRLNLNSNRTDDPLSFILNNIPKSKPKSPRRIQYLKRIWPIVCQILSELDAHQHPTSNQQQYKDLNPGQAFIHWIDPPPPEPD